MIKKRGLVKRKGIIKLTIALFCVVISVAILIKSSKTNGKIEDKTGLFNSGGSSKDGTLQNVVNNPKTIDEAVSAAVLSRANNYKVGEVATEGHLILQTVEEDKMIKVYAVASYGSYGFENGVFTIVSGSGAIPTVITFIKNENGEYILKEYKEPMDV